MRVYVWVLAFLMFSFCKNADTKSTKNFDIKKDEIPYRTLYEDKGLYPKGEPHIIHCPDFIRFLKGGDYYVLNDCNLRIIEDQNPTFDTVAETGRYKYERKLKRLLFFDRKKIKDASEFVFHTDEDTITLEDVSISKDILIFKFNKLDTLSFYFSRAK